MAQGEFDGGIRVDYDDRVFRVTTPAEPAGREAGGRRAGGFGDERPRVIGAAASAGVASELAQRLKSRGVMTRVGPVISIGAGPAAQGRTRATPAPGRPTRLSVPVAPGEQAVVLVEGDGVLAWRYGREGDASALAERRRAMPQAQRVLEFDLGLPPIGAREAGPTGPAQRGWLRDRLIDGVKAIVLYFAAEATAAAVNAMDRSRREGAVVILSADDASAWETPDDFSGVDLPSDRPARVLLLVHGTFSSTLGGFGELTVTPWGRRFLRAALGQYDAVLGFDHRTLSVDPRENAQAMAQALQTLPHAQPVAADVICHSRGGLVLRCLLEEALPALPARLTIGQAVFVAATNRGTELARPENWETLVDLVTNLGSIAARALSLFVPAAAGASSIAYETVDAIGDFVKYLVTVGVQERRVPGIAAMDPGSAFFRKPDCAKPGAPAMQAQACYAVVSDFYAKLVDDGEHEPKEMPRRLAFILADGVVDRLMRGDQGKPVPNDLVVDVASMTDIDSAVGGLARDVLDFGHNPLVYHTNYFLRPETVGRLALWLRLPSPLDAAVTRALDGGERQGVLGVPAGAPVADVRHLVERDRPRYLVFEREHPAAGPRRCLYYAVTPTEFLAETARSDGAVPVEQALRLGESSASRPLDAGRVPTDRRTRGVPSAPQAASAGRGVVLAGRRVQAVLDADSHALTTAALAQLARVLQDGAAAPVPIAPPEPEPEPWVELALPPPSSDELLLARDGGAWLGIGAPGRVRGGAVRQPPPRAKAGAMPDPGPRTRGGARPVAKVPPAVTAKGKAPPVVQPVGRAPGTFVSAEMPAEVRANRDAMVTVTLSAERLQAAAGQASDHGEVVLGPGRVTVYLVPRVAFDYIGGNEYQVEVDPPAPRAPVVLDFPLRARDVGPGEVTVLVRQGAQRLLTLTLRALVVAAAAQPSRDSAAAQAAVPGGDECDDGDCAILEIFDRRGNDELRYEYILRAGDVHNRYRSDPIRIDPQAYVAARYQDIQDAWTGSQRAAERFRVRLQAIGGAMFRQLFPPALKQALWRLAEQGELSDILVYSDEPFLPWEIVYLDDPAAPATTGRGRFLGELGLCRWLYGAAPTCRIRVRSDRVRSVVPHYPDPAWRLQTAEDEEEPMLRDEFHAQALAPRHDAIVQALSTPGSFDLLHFACHGAADAADIDNAALLLEGELADRDGTQTWAQESLRASVVDQVANLRGPDGNRPLVVVNACQTGCVGYSLSRLGGFAPAFLGAREGEAEAVGKAGAFVGALWSVGDFAASHFVHELYRHLRAGHTMAEAARAGRQAACDAGEGTWLAYTVYAHPHLRVQFD